MPTTPRYGLPAPADTDLVMDGARALRDLATATDAALDRLFYTGARTFPDPPTPGSSKSLGVTFTAGLFTAATLPRITLGVESPLSDRVYVPVIEDLTAAGFTLRLHCVRDPSWVAGGPTAPATVTYAAFRP